ncbi:MAG: adenosylcobinamide-phosphate synthase CbiB [Clostridiales bacterium]|nr:adenosylcobinamide-phosphate synthase CbiB [Clostridiales bacterium]
MKERLIVQTAALCLGFLIDFFVGDPYSIPHPVVAIGKLISFFDRKLRRGNSNPKDVGRGVLTVILVALISTAVPALFLEGAWRLHPILYLVLDSIMCWQILAARQLYREGVKVQRALEKGDTEGARYAVSMIVGRDTNVLDENGICRAAVETVAENTSDGVIAPLCWMILFGAAGGFFYKSINTMDSMLGYKNEKYLYFGRAAAKTDDVVNYLPARISALLMILVCPLCRLDAKNAWRIFKRDRYKHASPNSAQTESTCAGALGLRLAGDAVYGGVVHKKEFIGDPIRAIEPADITRAGRLMYAASFAMLLLGVLARILVWLCF